MEKKREGYIKSNDSDECDGGGGGKDNDSK